MPFWRATVVVEYAVGRSVVKALAEALLVKEVGADLPPCILYCLACAPACAVIADAHTYPLILTPLEQNICGEGAALRRRFLLEIPDSIFRFGNPLNRFRFSKSGVRSVICTVAIPLHASERFGKFADGFRKLPEVLFIPASRFSGTVIQCPIGQYPGIRSTTCMKTSYQRIRAGTCKAVEHGVIRRTDGALEIGASRLSLPGWNQVPRRFDKVFRIH